MSATLCTCYASTFEQPHSITTEQSVTRPLRSGRHHAGDAVADEAGLLVALYLEGEAGYYLPPALAYLAY